MKNEHRPLILRLRRQDDQVDKSLTHQGRVPRGQRPLGQSSQGQGNQTQGASNSNSSSGNQGGADRQTQ